MGWGLGGAERTCCPTGLLALFLGLEAVLVSSTASIPEASTAPTGEVKVPLKDELGAGALLLGKLADAVCFGSQESESHTGTVTQQPFSDGPLQCGMQLYLHPRINLE